MTTIQLINENTLMVMVGDEISIDVADKVSQYARAVKQSFSPVITDIVPSYTSLLITIDLHQITLDEFSTKLVKVLKTSTSIKNASSSPTIVIPVYYDPVVALDHKLFCQQSGLSFEEVVRLHTQNTYRVYAIGFAPGFAYLGNVDKSIALPRQKTPRAYVPKGSVAIADQQTAVYPKGSPGGWNIIGRTPISLIDYERENLSIFETGAHVQFEAIDKETFLGLGGDLSDVERNGGLS